MKKIEPPDSHHLAAVLGWLGLGCPEDARAELKQITPENRERASVLEAHWMICAHEEQWREGLEVACSELRIAPDESSGWLHRAYALRRVDDGGLSQAWEALLPAAKMFPTEPIIAYNLSCYACQMQQFDIARHWLNRAVAAGQKEAIKRMALADADLQPLWIEIQEL